MKIKLFTKKDCPNCPPAKKVAEELEAEGVTVEYYDVDDVDGMAEGSFYMVMATPTTVLVDDSGNEVESWRGAAPDVEKVKGYFSGGVIEPVQEQQEAQPPEAEKPAEEPPEEE